MQSCQSANYMFYNCNKLKSIPKFNTSNLISAYDMFDNCHSLITIPQLDFSKCVNVQYMFNTCNALESIPLLDFSSAMDISNIFGWSDLLNLTDLGGFTGLKIDWYDGLNRCPNLTRQSLLNVFNTIASFPSMGEHILQIGEINLNKLSDEDKMIAINKGWTLM